MSRPRAPQSAHYEPPSLRWQRCIGSSTRVAASAASVPVLDPPGGMRFTVIRRRSGTRGVGACDGARLDHRQRPPSTRVGASAHGRGGGHVTRSGRWQRRAGAAQLGSTRCSRRAVDSPRWRSSLRPPGASRHAIGGERVCRASRRWHRAESPVWPRRQRCGSDAVVALLSGPLDDRMHDAPAEHTRVGACDLRHQPGLLRTCGCGTPVRPLDGRGGRNTRLHQGRSGGRCPRRRRLDRPRGCGEWRIPASGRRPGHGNPALCRQHRACRRRGARPRGCRSAGERARSGSRWHAGAGRRACDRGSSDVPDARRRRSRRGRQRGVPLPQATRDAIAGARYAGSRLLRVAHRPGQRRDRQRGVVLREAHGLRRVLSRRLLGGRQLDGAGHERLGTGAGNLRGESGEVSAWARRALAPRPRGGNALRPLGRPRHGGLAQGLERGDPAGMGGDARRHAARVPTILRCRP